MNPTNKHINPDLKKKVRNFEPAYVLSELKSGILRQDRKSIGQALTLVESNRPQDIQLSAQLLEQLDVKNHAFRMVITGAPGVGKSTFITALCSEAIKQENTIAVLATDPSSDITKGSILGDKTRMSEILESDQIFVRPSASSNHLGGITKRSLEKMDILHAAGFDYIILETVGVGQSEFSAYQLSDLFILLVNPGGGDELQGMKRGIVEMADMICINKFDGENKNLAQLTKKQYESSNKLLTNPRRNWTTTLHLISSQDLYGIESLWGAIQQFENDRTSSGLLTLDRQDQHRKIIHEKAHGILLELIKEKPEFDEIISKQEKQLVEEGLSLSKVLLKLQKALKKLI